VIIPLIDPLAIGRQAIYQHVASRLFVVVADRFVIVTLAWFAFPARSQKPRGCLFQRQDRREGEGARRWRRRAAKSYGVA